MDLLKIKNILNEKDENIISFIKKMDVFFFPKIEDQINLISYVKKIKKYGCILGTYDSNNNINSLILFYCNDMDTKTAFISYLAISPEYQSKNIAKRLVQEALSISKNNMMSKCQVTTNSENKKAISFYKKNNFKEYNCKFERNRNTVFLEIDL